MSFVSPEVIHRPRSPRDTVGLWTVCSQEGVSSSCFLFLNGMPWASAEVASAEFDLRQAGMEAERLAG